MTAGIALELHKVKYTLASVRCHFAHMSTKLSLFHKKSNAGFELAFFEQQL